MTNAAAEMKTLQPIGSSDEILPRASGMNSKLSTTRSEPSRYENRYQGPSRALADPASHITSHYSARYSSQASNKS
jgi:hypothetical protein